MLEYSVAAKRIDADGSLAVTKQASIVLDTRLAGRQDAFNPVELLLASIAACMIKGIERVSPMLEFSLEGVEVSLHAVRQDTPPQIISIDYVLTIDSMENDKRLDLLHKNVRKYGTISNTIALAVPLTGVVRRKQ